MAYFIPYGNVFGVNKDAFMIKAALSNFLKRCFHSQKGGSKAGKSSCLESLTYNII